MNRVMKSMTSALAGLSIACLILGYLWIDRSLALSYARQSSDSASNTAKMMQLILEHEWRGLPEAEVLKRLNATFPKGARTNVVLKKEGGVIWADDIPFRFENGRLRGVGEP